MSGFIGSLVVFLCLGWAPGAPPTPPDAWACVPPTSGEWVESTIFLPMVGGKRLEY